MITQLSDAVADALADMHADARVILQTGAHVIELTRREGRVTEARVFRAPHVRGSPQLAR